MRKCSKEALDAVFARIAQDMELYIPVDGEHGAAYKKWEAGLRLSGALNTVKSPKELFFPQSEELMEFRTSGREIELIDTRRESGDFAVFGVRACDVRSFEVLDRVFLSEPADSYYADRREHAAIISMACTRPAETCFCTAFGVDPAAPAGDVSCWMTRTEVYFEANTEKGGRLLEKLAGLTEECGRETVAEQQDETRDIMRRLPLAGLTTDGFGGDRTQEIFDAPEWKTLSEACLGCGACTFVCPTCQCYDIKDFKTGKGVIRFRCWDSCMYSEFTRMSAGQPRLTQLERFRQRFMHKLVYYPANNDGMFSCVGCGRCVSSCPISMNIVKVMKTIGGAESE